MKILLLGKDGQVGWELQRALSVLGHVVACNHQEANLEQVDTLQKVMQQVCPQVVVNAAAYTAVDRAESEHERAMLINAEAVSVLAAEVKRQNAVLIHYSTDYVFDGKKQGAYDELDVAAPKNIYGKSKLAGERAIETSGCRYFIFRTSWVYGLRGKNFAKTILRLAQEKEELRVIDDQVGAPTSAELIADVTALVIYRLINDSDFAEHAGGIYHLVAAGETSWHGFATLLIQEALAHGVKLITKPENIQPISTEEYPLPAQRPANSRLNTQKLCDTFDVTLPPWQFHVRRMISELITENK